MRKIIESRILCCLAVLFMATVDLHAQSSGWTVNPHDFQYDMTLYGTLVVDGVSVSDYSNYEVAAFVGGECRGIATVDSKNGSTWLYMRIRSNEASGESVKFKVFNKAENKTYGIKETVSFQSDAMEGSPSSPTKLTLTNVTPGDVNGDGVVNSLDASLVRAYYLGTTTDINVEAADVNGDGVINSLDGSQIRQLYLKSEN